MSLFPVGEYECEIVDQGLGQSKEKKTNFFYLKFRPISRVMPDGSTTLVDMNTTRTYERYLTEKTIEFAQNELDFLGFTGESFGDLVQGSRNFCDFRGMGVNFYCNHQSVNGQTYEKWSMKSGDGGGRVIEPVTSNDIRKLDTLFGANLKSRAAKRRTASPPVNREPEYSTSDNGDDSIPF